jgi:hypothetical protein
VAEEDKNAKEASTEEEFEDQDEDIKPVSQIDESGYVHLVKAVVDPKDIVQRLEMSTIPKGKRAGKIALLLAQVLIIDEMDKRKDPEYKRVGYGTIALTALATVYRGEERHFIRDVIELKEIENKEESQIIKKMS